MGEILERIKLITYLIVCSILSSCNQKSEEAIYLIPKNFEGNILIFFNDENGVHTVYDDGNRVYNFDTSGILKTKFKQNYKLQKNIFFYIDSNGNKTPLRYLLPSQLKGTDEVIAFNQETGYYFDAAKSVDRHFEIVTIAKQKNISSIGNERSSSMWKKLGE